MKIISQSRGQSKGTSWATVSMAKAVMIPSWFRGWLPLIMMSGRYQARLLGIRRRATVANDHIYLTRFSQVKDGVHGDNAERTGQRGGNDNIQIDGKVGTTDNFAGVYGDTASRDGGDDFIHIEKHGHVIGEVVGDDVEGEGGSDLIWIDGLVTGSVMGDKSIEGNAKDQIAVRQGGRVNGSVVGDGSFSGQPGGWDVINIMGGQVDAGIAGDFVIGDGGKRLYRNPHE